jgi:amiloride-sensitive sodium channel subunit gamma
MSCSVVCVIEIIEVFFIDFFSIIARRQWQKAKEWWARKQDPSCPEASSSQQGQDNPALSIDDDLPTFTSAMRLPPAPEPQVPGTPPPRYNTLRLERTFSQQLTDTQLPTES